MPINTSNYTKNLNQNKIHKCCTIVDYADMAEWVDAKDLKSFEHYVHSGSSPDVGTKYHIALWRNLVIRAYLKSKSRKRSQFESE